MATHLDKAEQIEKDLKANQYAKFMYWKQMHDNAEITQALEMYWAKWVAYKFQALIDVGFAREEALLIICSQAFVK